MGSDQSVGPEHAKQFAEAHDHGHSHEEGHHEDGHAEDTHGHGHSAQVGTAALALGALGVVYGDIGTSPLYALKEAFTEKSHVMTVDPINVYGICSLAFWSLIIIISIKYLLFVMRAETTAKVAFLL